MSTVPDNELISYFFLTLGRPMTKWSNYFKIYDRHFSRFRGESVNVLEIGVGGGGSLQMWKWYFGDNANIFGIDIDESKMFEEDRIKTFHADQSDANQIINIFSQIGKLDIVIDDGSHNMVDQIISFETLYPRIDDNGIYLVEDTHTSFFEEYGGGVGNKNTFLSYIKDYIDKLTAFHSRGKIPLCNFSISTNSMHFYNSVVIIEKGNGELPPQKVSRKYNNKKNGE